MTIKKIIIAITLLVSAISFAQKDELKSLKKIYSKEVPSVSDLSDYKATLSKLEPLAIEESDKVYLNFFKGMLPMLEVNSLGSAANPAQISKIFNSKSITDLTMSIISTLDFEKKSGKKIYTDDINKAITTLKPQINSTAFALGKAKKEIEAATLFYSLYQLDKKDADSLFYAASYAVNSNDFENALKYYQELNKINYSGEGTFYYAINKTSKQDEYFSAKDQRDTYVKLGTHEKPHDEKQPSKRGEINKNIALILVSQGKNEEAKAAFTEARKSNPDDMSLLLNEANLYLTLNDFDMYTKLVNEALLKEPNNADLVFNLGVISDKANKSESAETYYRKAIEINPKYFNAYLNLAELKMRSDQKYVDEINKLGTSEKDLKKYEVVKAERNKNFMTILPILEKAVELDPTNDPAKKTLLSVYKALEMSDKVKELKAKM